MRRWMLLVNLFLSALGIFLAVSAFVVFFVYYDNLVAGTWTILSGVFASVCFHLHFLYWRNTLCDYHSSDTLQKLAYLGFVVTVISTAFCIWYVFAKFYWHVPMMPLANDQLIAGVWSFMTAKWSLHLYVVSNSYAQRLNTVFTPLLVRGISATSSVSA